VPGDRTLDALAHSLGDWPPAEGVLLDARATSWASPYGFTALLTLADIDQAILSRLESDLKAEGVACRTLFAEGNPLQQAAGSGGRAALANAANARN